MEMHFLYSTYIVLTLLCPFSSGVAKFTDGPNEKLFVVKGGTAYFSWDYHLDSIENDLDTISPIWYFTNKTFRIGFGNAFSGRKFKLDTSNCPQRLRVPSLRVSVMGKAMLVITNVTLADSGIYGLELFLGQGKSPINESQLVVTETPRFLATPNATTFVIEKTDLKVNCSAIGPPDPDVTWVEINGDNTIGKEQARGRGSVMLIKKSITRELQGKKYMCLARNNPNQSPVNATTTITVYYAPEIGKKFEQQSYCIGDKVPLNCVAVGNPKPNVTWSGPSGQKVDPSADLKMKEDKEFGNYTCFARNLVGSASYVLRLVKKNVSCQPPVTKPTPSPTDDVHPGIIAGVVIAALLAIAGLIVAIIFWKRRKLYTKDSENRNERSVRMNAIGDDDNVYATTQQPNREAPDRAQPTVQYAAVDKSKKTKKKRPGEGELIYADLDHETPAGERPPSDRRSTGGSGDQPTLYADIGSTRQETPRYGNLQDMDSM